MACPSCEFRPVEDLDLAYSLTLTSHYFKADVLEQIGAYMKAGSPCPMLPPDQEEDLLAVIRSPETRRLIQPLVGPRRGEE